jgi:lysozyme family protein
MRTIVSLLLALFLLAPVAQAADCQQALAGVFRNEGGLSMDPHDSGNFYKGKLLGTKYGIAASVYGGALAKQGKTIQGLTLADAAAIYNRDYFLPLHLDQVKSQWLASMFLDTAINCGVGTAAILMTRTINVLNGLGEDFPVDPVVGQKEIDWINDYTKTRMFEGEKDKARRALFGSVFKEMRSRRYVAIVRHDAKKLRYLPTWLERTYGE